jgi:hypothetical protein
MILAIYSLNINLTEPAGRLDWRASSVRSVQESKAKERNRVPSAGRAVGSSFLSSYGLIDRASSQQPATNQGRLPACIHVHLFRLAPLLSSPCSITCVLHAHQAAGTRRKHTRLLIYLSLPPGSSILQLQQAASMPMRTSCISLSRLHASFYPTHTHTQTLLPALHYY